VTVDNPRVRHIPIPNPDHQMRKALAASLLQSLDGAKEAKPQLLEAPWEPLSINTEGLLLVDLVSIAQLCREEKLGYSKIGEAVRRYKVGVPRILGRRSIAARLGTGTRSSCSESRPATRHCSYVGYCKACP